MEPSFLVLHTSARFDSSRSFFVDAVCRTTVGGSIVVTKTPPPVALINNLDRLHWTLKQLSLIGVDKTSGRVELKIFINS